MSKLPIQKVSTTEDRTLPIFSEIDELADRIRHRAYDLFSNRGFGHGHALDDWLTAERQILLPEVELVEEDDEFELNVAMPGFESGDVDVTATPTELIIKATREEREGDDESAEWSSFHGEGVYRRVPLPSAIDVEKVTAKLKSGVLEIEAPKAAAKKATAKKAKSKPAANDQAKAKSKVKKKAAKKKAASAKSAKAQKKPAKKTAKKAARKTSARK